MNFKARKQINSIHVSNIDKIAHNVWFHFEEYISVISLSQFHRKNINKKTISIDIQTCLYLCGHVSLFHVFTFFVITIKV